MNFRANYEEFDRKLTPEQRKIMIDKFYEIWRDDDFNGTMIRAMAYKFLATIGFEGGDKYEGS